MNNIASQDALYEALVLDIEYSEPHVPEFSHFGGKPKWWNWFGRPWVSYSKRRKLQKDIEYKNKEGKRHRIYGPAYISRTYEIEAWYKDGLMHREGGPAYTHRNNTAWFFEGQLHNLDGPAVIEGAGPKQYWIDGVKLSPKEFKKESARRKNKDIE